MFDFKEIARLVRMLERSAVNEIEIINNGQKIKLCKRAAIQNLSKMGRSTVTVANPSMVSPDATLKSEVKPEISKNIITIRSTMVGFVYLEPDSGVDPYVNVGDLVKKGQVLCYIEAMRLKSEITSDDDGKILKINVESGEPVDYDRPLFVIEKKE